MIVIDEPMLEDLWSYLWLCHRGRHKAVKSKVLCRRFACDNRTIIEAGRTLIIKYHRPVCASWWGKHRGIYAARSPAELADYHARLWVKNRGVFQRMSGVEVIMAEWAGQTEFDFEGTLAKEEVTA